MDIDLIKIVKEDLKDRGHYIRESSSQLLILPTARLLFISTTIKVAYWEKAPKPPGRHIEVVELSINDPDCFDCLDKILRSSTEIW